MRNLFAPVVLSVFACVSAPAAARAQPIQPDTIYHSAKVVTVNGADEIAQAVAVKDGRILAVGSNDAVRKLAGPSTKQIDLTGKTLLPGFYDNHIHMGEAMQPWRGGMVPAASDWLRDADTMDKLQAALKAKAAQTPKGEWIRGSVIREEWFNQKVPTRWDLDKVSPNNPVAIARGPHTLLLNSAALAAAKISRATESPAGGWIFKDDKGEPNGRVLEAARRMVESVIPKAPAKPGARESAASNYKTQLLQLASLGITSVNVAGVSAADLGVMQALYDRDGETLPRTVVQLRVSPGHDTYDDVELGIKNSIKELEGIGFHTAYGSDRLKVGAIKMSIDGGLSAPVFWSTTAYKGRPGYFGAQRIPDDAFYRVAKRAHELGWQVGVHVMGDAAVVMVVDQLERILREVPRADHRHYLHHVAVKPPDATLRKMAANNIGVASQPGFTLALGAYADEALDAARDATQNPSASLLKLGIKVSYGSDGGPYGPLPGIMTAVTRRGYDDKVHGIEEAVDVKTAVRLHTMGSAWMNFMEKVVGSIEVGKQADFVVLGQDILTIDPLKINQIPVERTIVAGKEIYSAKPVTSTAQGGRH